MYPPLFGPVIWDTALIIALNFPEQPTDMEQRYWTDFLYGMVYLLPCPSCKLEAVRYVTEHPPLARTREEAVQYVVDFHNFVNKRLGKVIVTKDEATRALVKRFDKDYKDLGRAMQVRKEDAEKIQELQAQVQKLQGGGTIQSLNPLQSEAFAWISLAEFILILIFIITIIILARRLRHQRNKQQHSLQQS